MDVYYKINMKSIPSLTIAQMREVDRMIVEEIGVSVAMMMENAGRNTAVMARRLLGGNLFGRKILILCGKGNNGGDGLAAARHLTNFGAHCQVLLAAKATSLKNNPLTQYQILQSMRVPLYEVREETHRETLHFFQNVDLIIDALLGYSLSGTPREPIAALIRYANQSKKPILAVDIPSGLSGDTGQAQDPTIQATNTITLALPKIGLLRKIAKKYVGKLYLADLSIPTNVYKKIGLKVPILFAKEEIFEVPFLNS